MTELKSIVGDIYFLKKNSLETLSDRITIAEEMIKKFQDVMEIL